MTIKLKGYFCNKKRYDMYMKYILISVVTTGAELTFGLIPIQTLFVVDTVTVK